MNGVLVGKPGAEVALCRDHGFHEVEMKPREKTALEIAEEAYEARMARRRRGSRTRAAVEVHG